MSSQGKNDSAQSHRDDACILESVIERNISEYGELISRYTIRAHNYALPLTHNEHIANDVVQMAHIKVIKRLIKGKGIRKYGPYLKKCIRARYCDLLRKAERYTNPPNTDVFDAIELDNEAMSKIDVVWLYDIHFKTLSDADRILFTLRANGDTLIEIAKKLCCNEKTVRNRLNRLIENAKSAWDRYQQ